MKIHLINKTVEPNTVLRNLTKFIAKKKGIINNIEISFFNRKKMDHARGRAYVGQVKFSFNNPWKRSHLGFHHSLKMWLPKNWKEDIPLENVCKVMEHEFDHTLGLMHKDMLPINELKINYLNEIKEMVK